MLGHAIAYSMKIPYCNHEISWLNHILEITKRVTFENYVQPFSPFTEERTLIPFPYTCHFIAHFTKKIPVSGAWTYSDMAMNDNEIMTIYASRLPDSVRCTHTTPSLF